MLPGLALAQTPITSASYVTEIVTTYGGFWDSGTGSGTNAPLNSSTTTPVKPDNSHLLLAFVVNSGMATVNGASITLAKKYFSTGVNDALLTTKGLAYTPGNYQALPVSALSGTISSNTKVALGQLYDGKDNGASTPPPAAGYAQYLIDGTQGLDLGTGVANLPAGTISFTISSLPPSTIGDGLPDILITQIAAPGSTADTYQVLDASGTQVANTKALSANFNDVAAVGQWSIDFYEASQNPMTLNAGFIKTERDLHLVAVDWSAFGITASNYASVKQLQIKLSGSSDMAFVAYNTASATLTPLPVQLTAFTGQLQGRAAHLTWQTASELNSAYFDVEASTDGHSFGPMGRVAAAGSSQQPRYYQLDGQLVGPGNNYYRLRQVDLDGSAHYSPTVVLHTGAAAVEVFPSVFTERLTVRLPAAGTASLTLLGPDGRLLRQQELLASPEAQDVALADLAGLPAGLYLLRVVVDGQAVVQRVVKQ
ncbi:MAG: T9SS type A sorting domain-containing protein [Janthinobacterium lividum]